MTGESLPLTIRPATLDDADAIEAIAASSWPDRPEAEYLPAVFERWVARDDAHTVVAEVTDSDAVPADAPAVAGIAQVQLLAAEEAWAQGMRVHPAYRGEGVGSRIVEECFSWARERGATIVRNMVFAWNGAGLGQSRATGFEPATELRFGHPEPDADAEPSDHGPADAEVVTDPSAAWRYWTHSDARDRLSGLAADDEEAWAVRELTRDDLETPPTTGSDVEPVAEGTGALAIRTGDGTVAMAARTRVDEYHEEDSEAGEEGDGEIREVVYGASAWDDLDACAALVSAVAADAAALDADRTKLLAPEGVGPVSDLAACRVPIHEEPDFVLAADLTGEH